MTCSFDLFRNPFVLMGLDLSASAKHIADAFEDAIADGHASQQELTAARQAMLRPLLRLEAEVRSLLDTPQREWRPILTALRSSQTTPELRRAFANVAPLSRSNLLAHIASRTPPDAPTLTAWITAQSAIESNRIHQTIEQFRKAAGIVLPDRTAVSSALNDLRDHQARALFDSFASPSEAIEVVTSCTSEVISSGVQKNIDALGTLLSAYCRYIDQELLFRRERVKSTGDTLRSDPDGPGNLALVIDALRFWQLAGQPLQLIEAYKGRDEPNAQEVFQDIRKLAIDLANDLSRFDVALSITNACQEVFARLPRATQQLAEDQVTLQERILMSKVDPLAVAIGELGDQLHQLASDLRRAGFGTSVSGSARQLRDAFIKAVSSSRGSAVADLPWLMLRSLAVKLNNDLEAHDSALALVKGLLELAGEISAPKDVRTRLREDKRAIERNQIEKALLEHLKEGRLSAALSAVENLLQDYKSPEERDTLQRIKSDIERRKIGQYFRWAFWPAIVFVGLIIANMDKSPDTAPRPRVPSTQHADLPRPARTAERTDLPRPARIHLEEMPPVGTERTFSEANIRYCTFQKVRLEFIQPRASTRFEIDEFNRLVDDFNSRCGSYRYRPSDRSTVESELIQKRLDLESQAQRILNGWRLPQLGAQPPLSSPSKSAPAPSIASQTAPSLMPATPTTPESNERTSLDLLKIGDASRVQSRLVELGFLKGPADGTWGPQSRSALRAFRAAVGLPASDAWDPVAAGRLFSNNAVRATGSPISQEILPDAMFAPPTGATLHPLNKDDALQINSKLREMGLYQGKNDFLWSMTSRAALREFKAKNDLPADDDWDAATEQRLFSVGPSRLNASDEERFAISFSGTWGTTTRACTRSGTVYDDPPVTITRKRAEAGGAGCDFWDIRADGERWIVKARCRSGDSSWAANISLSRIGNQMKWTSERGTLIYSRCES
jgi:peptidoglycan hydrolase-like protein with peptidoglycan-binding domain